MRKILSIFLIGLLGGITGSLLVKYTPQPNLLPFRGEGVDEGRMVKDDGQAEAEEITLTTYYPSPYGVYESMVAVRLGVGDTSGPFGSPDGKYDNLDSPPSNQPGNVWIRGNVGIGGLPKPGYKISVYGKIWAEGNPTILAQDSTLGFLLTENFDYDIFLNMKKINLKPKNSYVDLEKYSGKWVAFVNNQLLTSDKDLNELMQKVKKYHLPKEPSIMLIPRKDEGPYILIIL